MFKRLQFASMAILFAIIIASLDSSAHGLVSGHVANPDDEYAGAWSGSYTNDGGATGNLWFTFSHDANGQWTGTLKYTNQDGEQTAIFKTLKLGDGKLNAVLETPDGEGQITIEGAFHGDQLEGTYKVVAKSSGESVDGGKWNVTRKKSS